MTIESVSKADRSATITLDATELTKLCNTLYKAPEDQRNGIYYRLYNDMMIVKDLTQYGHLDDFRIEKVVKCRSNIK